MKNANEQSQPFMCKPGVCQGCMHSPRLFNIYGETVIRIETKSLSGEVSIRDRRMDNLRYAQDTTLIATDELFDPHVAGAFFTNMSTSKEDKGSI